MSDIQTPNGLETAEALDDSDLMEVFQDPSGGTRKNKKALLSVLKTFFQKFASFTDGNLLSFDSVGTAVDSGVLAASVSTLSNLYFASVGLNNIVFSNFATTSAPEIISGSQADIAGTLYTNGLNVVISGATSNSTWYDILITPSGTSFTASYIASGTGVWSDLYKGLYSGTNRVIGRVYRDGSGNFISKNVLIVNNRTVKVKMETGDWDMDTTTTLDVFHGLSDFKKIRSVNVIIRNDADDFYYSFNNFLVQSSDLFSQRIEIISDRISLARDTDGAFDGTNFDSPSFNRGWITIDYEV